MPWVWFQDLGELCHETQGVLTLVARGYSGRGAHINRPSSDHLRAQGPIPVGRYRIGLPRNHPVLGPFALPLIPEGHDAKGRTGFYIHGDNALRNRTASSGCIIISRPARERVAGGPSTLSVVDARIRPGR